MRLRVATYNIRRGGRPRQALLAGVLGELDPDLVVLQEAIDRSVLRAIASEVSLEVALAERGRSVAILARPGVVADATWHHHPGSHSVAEVMLAEPGIRVLGAHLTAGLSGRGERRRWPEAERLLALAARPPGPELTIIAGDLNAIAPGELPRIRSLPMWIRLLLRVDGGIGTRVVGRLLEAGFTDAWRLPWLGPTDDGPSGPRPTMPAVAPSVRLDYLLLGSALVQAAVACGISPGDEGRLRAASDHLPVFLDLDLGLGPTAIGASAGPSLRAGLAAAPDA